MFNKKNTSLAMYTVLGEYTTFAGNVESDGSVKILGKVEGDIKASGDVYIETTSSVTGNVYGSNVYISGYIKGNVLAKGIIHLMAQARLYGDIEVSGIVTDEGAIFQGNCKMVDVNDNQAAAVTSPKTKIKSKRDIVED